MDEQVLTLQQAAEFLQLCRQTVAKLDVPSHHIPGTNRRRYLKSELVAWLKAANSTEGRLELVFRTKCA